MCLKASSPTDSIDGHGIRFIFLFFLPFTMTIFPTLYIYILLIRQLKHRDQKHKCKTCQKQNGKIHATNLRNAQLLQFMCKLLVGFGTIWVGNLYTMNIEGQFHQKNLGTGQTPLCLTMPGLRMRLVEVFFPYWQGHTCLRLKEINESSLDDENHICSGPTMTDQSTNPT